MILAGLVFALVVGLVFSALVTTAFGWRHPRNREGSALSAAIFAFVIIFLFALAGGVWIDRGPILWGTAWLPYVIFGLFAALLLLAAAIPADRAPYRGDVVTAAGEEPGTRPPRDLGRGRGRRPTAAETTDATVAATAFGVFFWILIVSLALAILAAIV